MESIYDKIKKNGGIFYSLYTDADTFDICVHVQGEEKDIILHSGVKEFDVGAILKKYTLKYRKKEFKDMILDSRETINDIVEKYNTKLEELTNLPTKEELLKLKLRGDGGLYELAKKYNIEYGKLPKEELVERLYTKIIEKYRKIGTTNKKG